MSEHDRGAYAPLNEGSLAFDPRRESRRGPAPFTLAISAVLLLCVVGGVMVLYRHGVRHHGEAPQLVGAPIGSDKTAAPAGAQSSTDESAGLQVYKTEATPANEATPATGPATTLAAGPEQPQPRPVTLAPPPPAPVVASPLRPAETVPAAPKVVAAAPAAPKPVAAPKPAPVQVAAATLAAVPAVKKPAAKPVKVASNEDTVAASAFASGDTTVAPARHEAPPKPAKVVAPKAAAAPKVAVAPAKPVAAKTPAATTAKPAAAPASGGGAMVQIGAFSSEALAQEGAGEALRAAPAKAAGKTRKVESTVKDGKTFYRGLVGGFASHADAVAFCEALRAAGKTCIVR